MFCFFEGLDPAKPLFITVGTDRRLDAGDADFVDVIHTDVLGRGMLRSMGHVDFYPNIGSAQPGCEATSSKYINESMILFKNMKKISLKFIACRCWKL